MASDMDLRTELTIDGMSCAACATKVQIQLRGIDGVLDANVNFATGKATVLHGGRAKTDELSTTVQSLGYSVIDHDQAELAQRRRETDLWLRFRVALILTVPALLLGMVSALRFSGWEWLVAALTTPVILWSGWPFHRAAWMNLRHGSTTMDTLVSLGSLAALLWSSVVLLADIGNGEVYFETGAVIITLILLGKWFELRAKKRTGDAIRALADLGAKTATLADGSEVPIESITVGQRFLVRPGEKVATDGVVIEGHSAIDTSMITGEPVPVEVEPDALVVGATINANGSLVVEATRVGADTALAQIIRLVDEAQGSRAEVQRLADRVAAVFVPIAIAIALITLVAWLATGQGADAAFTASVAVLIISCPCALGLATPLAIMVGTGRGAQLGVLIKGGEVLEDTRAVDVIVLDKTGTITEGRMALVDTAAPNLANADALWLHRAAAAIEAKSEHPIAQAIATSVDGDMVVNTFDNRPGYGVTGTVDQREVRVGRRELFDSVPTPVNDNAIAAEELGHTVVFAGQDGTAQLIFVVADRVKDSSADAIRAFRDAGLAITMLTGDNQRSADAIATSMKVDNVIAEVFPEDKAAEIKRLQDAGKRVAMVGDGVNDAPALAQADLGIAIGTGTDVAIEASDLTVVSGDLLAVADAIALARRTLSTIKGNLFWAFAYNAAAIPLAALGILSPMIAAIAMGLSSLFVVSNSLRLKRFSGYRSAGP